MKIGLVLGAGGVLGGAWLVGGLQALGEIGLSARDAEVLVGTSAGAAVGAIVMASPRRFFSHNGHAPAGRDLEEQAQALVATFEPSTQAIGSQRLPSLLPGSPNLFLAALQGRASRPALSMFAGLLPAGRVSTEPLRRAVEANATHLPRGSHFWAVACDYQTGERVVFGRKGAPPATIEQMVIASCAVPGHFQPELIAGRKYVDGGLHSVSNLDVLTGRGLDLVVSLTPMTSPYPSRSFNPIARAYAAFGKDAHDQLLREARPVREGGTRVVLIEPTPRDLAVRGWNLMDPGPSDLVRRTAYRTVSAQLRRLRLADMLTKLR